MYLQATLQTLNRPSKGIKSLSDIEVSVDKHFTRPTASNDDREAANRSLATIQSLNKLPLKRIPINRSLNNSLIEEECEDSPRRNHSPSLEPRLKAQPADLKAAYFQETMASDA